MELLMTIVVTSFAGMDAGLATGFAGMSAAAVICGILMGFICGFIGAGGGMMMPLILTSVLFLALAKKYILYENGC